MPVYTYRREDGTTFDMRQKFLDEPLEICPTTGQKVVRVIHPAGVIFKGSGFYVNDSKGTNPAGVATNGVEDKQKSTDSKAKDSATSKSDAKDGSSKTSTNSGESKSKESSLPKAAGE